MRISEAIALEQQDVDMAAGLLEVRNAKFGKSRWVPLHPSVTQQLRNYASERDASHPHRVAHRRFFIGEYSRPLTAQSVRYAFKLLRKQLGWKARGDHAYPRIHDLRHAFICRTIQRWYDEGLDIDSHMLSLSTYVGHAHVTDTYWYVTATPSLMARAAQRFTSLHTEGSGS
jgi:integrase